jgi:hypothetical protein
MYCGWTILVYGNTYTHVWQLYYISYKTLMHSVLDACQIKGVLDGRHNMKRAWKNLTYIHMYTK